jgi:hypothetical protein
LDSLPPPPLSPKRLSEELPLPPAMEVPATPALDNLPPPMDEDLDEPPPPPSPMAAVTMDPAFLPPPVPDVECVAAPPPSSSAPPPPPPPPPALPAPVLPSAPSALLEAIRAGQRLKAAATATTSAPKGDTRDALLSALRGDSARLRLKAALRKSDSAVAGSTSTLSPEDVQAPQQRRVSMHAALMYSIGTGTGFGTLRRVRGVGWLSTDQAHFGHRLFSSQVKAPDSKARDAAKRNSLGSALANALESRRTAMNNEKTVSDAESNDSDSEWED